MEIFANHAHIFSKSSKIENFSFKGGTVGDLRKTMDECGINKCVCFAEFFEWGWVDYDANEYLYSEIKNKNEFVGFGVINFAKKYFKEQVQKITDLGFKGIKIHPQFQQIRVDSFEAYQVCEQAEKAGLFLSFHTGIHGSRISDSRLLMFDEISYRFPGLSYSLEHVGGHAFFNEALAVIANRKWLRGEGRAYAGLTSVFDNDLNRLWYLDENKIKDLLHLAGEDLCIFGLDFPWNGVDKIKNALDSIKQMDVGEEAKRKILGGNLEQALNVATRSENNFG